MTWKEVIAIIEDFYERRNKWPTKRQVFIKSRLRSPGDMYNVLNDMVEDGILERVKPLYGPARVAYALTDSQRHSKT